MPDESPSRVPVPASAGSSTPLDRAATERVLARAAELQALSGDTAERGLTEAQLVELGNEVGISVENVRQALAEERTRVAVVEEHGVIGSWFGPTIASSSRVVRGTPAEVMALLDAWMQKEELLRVRRRFGDRVTWEARRDFMGALQSSFNIGGRPYALTSAEEVGAHVVAVDQGRVLVRIDADFAPSRRRSVGWASVTAGLGVTSGAGILALGSLAPELAGLVIAGAIGTVSTLTGGLISAAVAKAQRGKIARAQLALEQILDRLEHGEIKAPRNTLMEFLNAAVR